MDEAVSEAESKHRPGFNALLAACEPRPPYGVLIVSELSRIGRDTVRTPGAILQLEEADVEIHSYLSGAGPGSGCRSTLAFATTSAAYTLAATGSRSVSRSSTPRCSTCSPPRRRRRDCRSHRRGGGRAGALLGRHVTQARQVVRQLLEGRLVCQPFEDAEARGYHFSATGTYRRLGVSDAVNYGGGPNGIPS